MKQLADTVSKENINLAFSAEKKHVGETNNKRKSSSFINNNIKIKLDKRSILFIFITSFIYMEYLCWETAKL